MSSGRSSFGRWRQVWMGEYRLMGGKAEKPEWLIALISSSVLHFPARIIQWLLISFWIKLKFLREEYNFLEYFIVISLLSLFVFLPLLYPSSTLARSFLWISEWPSSLGPLTLYQHARNTQNAHSLLHYLANSEISSPPNQSPQPLPSKIGASVCAFPIHCIKPITAHTVSGFLVSPQHFRSFENKDSMFYQGFLRI